MTAGAEKKENAEFAYCCIGVVPEKCGIEEAIDEACPPSERMIF